MRDRELAKRLTIVAAFVFVFTAAFAHLERTYSQKFYDVTGRARWIWAQHRMSDDVPVAFFAARDFELPQQRIFTRLKVVGDPEYTVYVNGRELAGRRLAYDEHLLDVYDISELVKTGRNRIVIAVRAPRGAGALIAAIDIAPEVANWVVTDGSWKIYRGWTPEILRRDPPGMYWQPPMIIGEPPIGRWNYPAVHPLDVPKPAERVIAARRSFELFGNVPTVRTEGGVAVAGTVRQRARAFDFGGAVEGRVRVTMEPNTSVSQVVELRFANAASELPLVEWGLRPVVFAPGESVVTIPDARRFRYVMVFGRLDVQRVDVVR